MRGIEVGSVTAIKGRRPTKRPKRSRTFSHGRVCSYPGCNTRLSLYNSRPTCFLHTPAKAPRVRGIRQT